MNWGDPNVHIPYRRPGCLDRIVDFLSEWLVRLLQFGAGVAAGAALMRGCEG